MDLISCAGLSFFETIAAAKVGGRPVDVATPFLGEQSHVFWLLFVSQYLLLKWYRIFLYPWYFSPLRHLPTAKDGNLPFFGQAINFFKAKTPTSLYVDWMREFPDAPLIRYVTVAGAEVVVCNSLNSFKDVLQTHCYSTHRPETWRRITNEIIRIGLGSMEGDLHRSHRKMLNSSFGPSKVRQLLPIFRSKVQDLSDLLDRAVLAGGGETGTFDCTDTFSKATLDMIGIATIGMDLSNLKSTTFDGKHGNEYTFHHAYNVIFAPDTIGKLLMFGGAFVPTRWLPLKANRDFMRATNHVFDSLTEVVLKRFEDVHGAAASGKYKRSSEAVQDILTFVVEESLPGGSAEGIRKDYVVGHILQLLAAGHDTSANGLSWASYVLATEPDIQDTLRNEIMGLLHRTSNPTVAEIDSLKYLNNFIKEALRRYSPATAIFRETGCDLNIDGVWVPKGTTVDIVADSVQRNPAIWGEDADEINPDRWDDLTEPQSSPYAFMSFSNGPRVCIGKGVAMLEMKVIMIELISNYRLMGVAKPFTVEVPAVTRRPNGLEVRIEKINKS